MFDSPQMRTPVPPAPAPPKPDDTDAKAAQGRQRARARAARGLGSMVATSPLGIMGGPMELMQGMGAGAGNKTLGGA